MSGGAKNSPVRLRLLLVVREGALYRIVDCTDDDKANPFDRLLGKSLWQRLEIAANDFYDLETRFLNVDNRLAKSDAATLPIADVEGRFLDELQAAGIEKMRIEALMDRKIELEGKMARHKADMRQTMEAVLPEVLSVYPEELGVEMKDGLCVFKALKLIHV